MSRTKVADRPGSRTGDNQLMRWSVAYADVSITSTVSVGPDQARVVQQFTPFTHRLDFVPT